MREDALQKGRRRLGPYLHQVDVAYCAAGAAALVGMHEAFRLFFRQLFSRDVPAVLADHDVAPADQSGYWNAPGLIRFYEISLNDGVAPTNLAMLYFKKTACSLPQSLHRILTFPEMLR